MWHFRHITFYVLHFMALYCPFICCSLCCCTTFIHSHAACSAIYANNLVLVRKCSNVFSALLGAPTPIYSGVLVAPQRNGKQVIQLNCAILWAAYCCCGLWCCCCRRRCDCCQLSSLPVTIGIQAAHCCTELYDGCLTVLPRVIGTCKWPNSAEVRRACAM